MLLLFSSLSFYSKFSYLYQKLLQKTVVIRFQNWSDDNIIKRVEEAAGLGNYSLQILLNPKIPQTDLLESSSQADHKGSWVCVYMSTCTIVYKHTPLNTRTHVCTQEWTLIGELRSGLAAASCLDRVDRSREEVLWRSALTSGTYLLTSLLSNQMFSKFIQIRIV